MNKALIIIKSPGIGDLQILLSYVHQLSKEIGKPVSILVQKSTGARSVFRHDKHIDEIYKDPEWPSNPLFYACCPSKTDKSVAPSDKENLFLLMPIAAGIQDNVELREKYFNIMMYRLERYCQQEIIQHIEYKRSYCVNDFKNDYNAYKGNAYGLANTLSQTANLKPKIINKKINNLFYTGQLTVPGPGVPPAIISGQVVADYILKS